MQAHRTLITRKLKGLESLIGVHQVDYSSSGELWQFTGQNNSASEDPLHPGITTLKQLYLKADPNYTGRYTVPLLWDTKKDVPVNNESSEILRILAFEFDHLLPEAQRETNRPGGGLYPEHLRSEIDALNEKVYRTVNNGVYMVGFAKSQESYNSNIISLFAALDELDAHLENRTFLVGDHLTEADIRLYVTLVRFDAGYNTSMQCSLKNIRNDYPHLHRYLRRLYWDNGAFNDAFRTTTLPLNIYTHGYAESRRRFVLGNDAPLIVPSVPGEEVLIPRLTA